MTLYRQQPSLLKANTAWNGSLYSIVRVQVRLVLLHHIRILWGGAPSAVNWNVRGFRSMHLYPDNLSLITLYALAVFFDRYAMHPRYFWLRIQPMMFSGGTNMRTSLQSTLLFINHPVEKYFSNKTPRVVYPRESGYSSVPNKRTSTPYLISTKLSPCTLLFGTASLSILLDLCQIFRPNLKKFWEKLGIFSKVFLLINKVAGFSLYSSILIKIPPCTLIWFLSKFHPVRLFRPVCLFGRLEYVLCSNVAL